MEINIENIIDAITVKLDACFGDSYTIYTDEIPQGFKTPSFGVLFLSLTQKRFIGGRWFVSALFDISYFTDKGRVDASSHSFKVQWNLKNIELLNGVIMLGKEFDSEMVDGVSHNMINFDFFLQEEQERNFMLSLDQYQKVRR